MKRTLLAMTGLLASILLLAGCSQEVHQGQVIARVNGSVLTYDMIRDRLDTSTAIEPQVRELAQNWVDNEVIYQQASKLGYENIPAVTQPLEEMKRRLAVNVFLQKQIYEKVALNVTEDEERRYYDLHKQEFLLSEEKVKLNYSVFADRDQATTFRTEVVKGTRWTDALDRVMRSPGAKGILEAAESQYFTQSTLAPSDLWKVVQTLTTNETSFPVKTPVGYYVLYLFGRQAKGEIGSFESVRDEIRQRIIKEQRDRGIDSILAELKKNSTIEMNITNAQPMGDTTQQ